MAAQIFTIKGKSEKEEIAFSWGVDDSFLVFHLKEEGASDIKNLADTIIQSFQNVSAIAPSDELLTFLNQASLESKIIGLAAAKIEENKNLIIGGFGDAFLTLLRNNKKYALFKNGAKPTVLAGEFKPNDILILATREGKQVLDNICLSPDNLALEVQNLSHEVEAREHSAGIALLIAQNEKRHILPEANRVFPLLTIAKKIIKKICWKIMRISAIVFAAIFVVFISWRLVNGFFKDARNRLAKEKERIENFQSGLKTAQELLGLNNMRSASQAGEILSEIEKLKNTAFSSKENQKKLMEIKKELENIITKAQGIVQTKSEVIYSTTFLKKDSLATKIAIAGNQIIIFDSSQKSAYAVNLNTKKADTVETGKVAQKPTLLSTDDGTSFLAGDNIVKLDFENKKAKTVLTKDSGWGEIVDFVSYGGNLYLLDVKNKQIWKYARENSGYLAAQKYFSTSIDLSKSISFAIDSAIYVLSKNGKITKYLSGEPQTFDGGIPDSSLKNPIKIVTKSDLEKVYVLEPEKKRIVIFDKKGEYQAQIIDNKLAVAGDFCVSEKDKLIYFSSGSDISKIEIP